MQINNVPILESTKKEHGHGAPDDREKTSPVVPQN
jgi:hypothetical protein